MEWNAGLYEKSSALQQKVGLACLELLNPTETDNILDIGCGDGRLSVALAKKARRGKITAIDASQHMIAQASGNALREGIPNARFLCMNALDMPFLREFDAIFSNYALHWIKDQKTLYRKIFDALKPGGRLIASVLSKEGGPPSGTLIAIGFTALLEIVQQERYQPYLDGMSNHPIFNFLTADTTRNLLESAGFSSITLDTRVFIQDFETIDDYIEFDRGTMQVSLINCFPEAMRPEVEQQLTSAMLREWAKIPAEQQEAAMSTSWETLFINASRSIREEK